MTGLFLFLKISRSIRVRREKKRFRKWNQQEHGGGQASEKEGRFARHHHNRQSRLAKGKNAFDIIEEDEGIPG